MGIFLRDFKVFDLIGVIISFYLILMIISYASDIKKYEIKFKLDPLVIMLGLYLYIRFGYENAIVALVLMILLILMKTKVPLYLLMLSYVIDIPFFLIDLFIDKIGFHLLSYRFYGVLGFILMGLIIIKLIKALNQEEA